MNVANGTGADADDRRIAISVIVVAQNVENFIQQALQSVAHQLPPDSELIYVDNDSSDATLRLAREVASGHPSRSIRIIANDENVGLGKGRNQGIDAARGDYLLFLDGDDWFAEGALRTLSSIARKHSPDLVSYSHARYFPDGGIIENKYFRTLPVGRVETIEHRRLILHNLNVAWNKLYRRQFVIENGMEFGDGFYEDIDWNYQALLLAERLVVIPDVLIYYRQRPGSILRSVDPRHFDVFRQWDNVLDFLRDHPQLAATYGAEIEEYARGQLANVLRADHRVPEDMKPAFFGEMSKVWRRFATELPRHPRRRKIDRLIEENRYWAYRALVAYDEGKRALRARGKQARKELGRTLRSVGPAVAQRVYEDVFLKLPVNPKRVVFEAYWGKKMDCNPYEIFRELAEIGGYECIWVLREDAEDRGEYPYERVRPGTLRYQWALATAKYFVSNVNFPTEMLKRPGTVHVQTKHGTPLKVMGLDIRPVRPKDMNWKALATRCQRWDYVISSNPYSSKVWRRAFPYNYRILESGYPRNDIFHRSGPDRTQAIRRELGVPDGKKVALYAPTFRDADLDANRSVRCGDCFDPSRVLDALGPEYMLLLRAHYLMTSDQQRGDSRILDVSSYVDTNEICAVTDLLITDYSSIMFDYANTGRPIVLYLYDYERYMEGRGTYFDIRESAPGPVAYDEPELIEILSSQAWEAPSEARKLEAFRQEFCPYDDGFATSRVVREVFGVAKEQAFSSPAVSRAKHVAE